MDYMDYNGCKRKIKDFTGIYYSTNDDEIEECYSFIDKLEEMAETDARFYELVSDCYTQVLDYKKAKEAFMKIYNPSDKKHMKKLQRLSSMECCPVTRPSGRAEKLPVFKYTAKNTIKNLFIKDDTRKCCTCGNKSDAFYIGNAYTNSGDKKVCFANEEKLFCATCLENGNAAKQLNIYFNSVYIDGLELIDKIKREKLIKNTPSCSYLFENFYEDAWPFCCNDFCCYDRKEMDVFYFKCPVCNKEITITGPT